MKNTKCPVCSLTQHHSNKHCQHCGHKFHNPWPNIFLTLTILSAGLYLYFLLTPCKLPITYSLGNVDNRLNISTDDAKAAAISAENKWEKAVGKDIFRYDENSKLKIDFIYSPEQKEINDINDQIKKLAIVDVDALDINTQFEKLFSDLNADYTKYETALDKYTADSDKWQKAGSFANSTYIQLLKDKETLDAWRAQYEAKRIAIQKSQDLVNRKIEIQNKYADSTKKDSNLTDGQFISGQNRKGLTNSTIQIFAFDGRSGLIALLTHEMGHEFTRLHAKNEESIMYPTLNTKQTGDLTSEDISLFCSACNIKK